MCKRLFVLLVLSFSITFLFSQGLLKKLDNAVKKANEKLEEINKTIDNTNTKEDTKVTNTQTAPANQTQTDIPVVYFYPRITPETKIIRIPKGANVQESIIDGVFWVEHNDKYAYFNENGDPFTNFGISKGVSFSNGAGVIPLAYQQYGILYKDKRCIALPESYKMVTGFVNGVALAYKKGNQAYMQAVYINVNGDEIYPPLVQTTNMIMATTDVEYPKPLSEGLRAHYDYTSKKYGYIDEAGKIVIKPQFYEANAFSDGVAVVKFEKGSYDNTEWSFIDKTGKILFTTKDRDKPSDFSFDKIRIKAESELYYYVDNTGKKISRDYTYASSFTDGYAFVNTTSWSSADNYIVIDKDLKYVRKTIKGNITHDPVFMNGLAVIQTSSEKTPVIVRPDGIIQIGGRDYRNKFGGFYDYDQSYCLTYLDKTNTPTVGFIDRNGVFKLVFKEISSSSDKCDCDTVPDITPVPPKPVKYKLTLIPKSLSGGAGGSVNGSGEYTATTKVTITATPAKDYKFIAWKKGDRIFSDKKTCDYIMQAENDTLIAFFSKKLEEFEAPCGGIFPPCEGEPKPQIYRYVGPYSMVVDNFQGPTLIDVTFVLELDPSKNISNYYGDHEYGVLGIINDPGKKIIIETDPGKQESMQSSINVCLLPLRINGFVKENEQDYMVMSGGGSMTGNVNWIIPKDNLFNAYLTEICREAYPNDVVVYGQNNYLYRVPIKALPDGSLKFGQLQRYSYLTGWTDPHNCIFEKYVRVSGWLNTLMGSSWVKGTNMALEKQFMDGAILKPTKENPKYEWLPPAGWFVKEPYDNAVKTIINCYKSLKTDVDILWENAD